MNTKERINDLRKFFNEKLYEIEQNEDEEILDYADNNPDIFNVLACHYGKWYIAINNEVIPYDTLRQAIYAHKIYNRKAKGE